MMMMMLNVQKSVGCSFFMQLTHLRIHVPYRQHRYITYITYILPYGSISTALFARRLGLCLPVLQHVSDIYIVFLFEV